MEVQGWLGARIWPKRLFWYVILTFCDRGTPPRRAYVHRDLTGIPVRGGFSEVPTPGFLPTDLTMGV